MNTLALVMIVRNEARCLERCLSSARAWVDEMLVLDTGSTDDTVAIARRCGARVHAFEWIDDFAAARNQALALAQSHWRLVLDADEWIESGTEGLRSVRDATDDFIGLVRVSSLIGTAQARQHAPSWLPRVLPAGVRYEGRIHEQPQAALPRRRLPLVVGHDGYLPEQMRLKQGRNETLLRRALAERPGDAYWSYQLGKDLEIRAEFAAALPYYEAALAGASRDVLWRHDLVLRLIYTLKSVRRFEGAMALARAEEAHWSDSPDFHFTVGDLLLDWALSDASRAIALLPQIEARWLRAVEIGERPDLPDSVQGRGSHLAAHNLAVFHESLGRTAQAEHWRALAQAWRTQGRTTTAAALSAA